MTLLNRKARLQQLYTKAQLWYLAWYSWLTLVPQCYRLFQKLCLHISCISSSYLPLRNQDLPVLHPQMSRQAGLLLLLSSVPLAWSDTDVSFQLIILPHRLYYAYHVPLAGIPVLLQSCVSSLHLSSLMQTQLQLQGIQYTRYTT